jgi:hypothetical protein
MISPPRLFTFAEKDNRLLPPKPKSAKELPNRTDEVGDSIKKLQNECECLKEILKVELKKSDASTKLIDSLVTALEVANHSSLPHNDLDETLLLDDLEKEETIDKICQRNAEMEK